MALTTEQQREVYTHLGVFQVSVLGMFAGGLLLAAPATHAVQTAINSLTPMGETSVVSTLAILERLRNALATSDTRMQASTVGKIVLNPKEWQDRQMQYQYFRLELARILGVEDSLGLSGGREP